MCMCVHVLLIRQPCLFIGREKGGRLFAWGGDIKRHRHIHPQVQSWSHFLDETGSVLAISQLLLGFHTVCPRGRVGQLLPGEVPSSRTFLLTVGSHFPTRAWKMWAGQRLRMAHAQKIASPNKMSAACGEKIYRFFVHGPRHSWFAYIRQRSIAIYVHRILTTAFDTTQLHKIHYNSSSVESNVYTHKLNKQKPVVCASSLF